MTAPRLPFGSHFGATEPPKSIPKLEKSDVEKQQLSVLCSLPGVAEKSAIRLLEKFGTPLDVLCAPITELAKTPGLGESKAKKEIKIG